MHKLFFIICFFLSSICFSNPFLAGIPYKDSMQEEDFVQVQSKLRTLNLESLLDDLYPTSTPFKWFWEKPFLQKKSDFQGRISRGKRQTLIDLSQGKKPEKKLIRINQGGPYCIVSFASFDGIYPGLLDDMPNALEKAGFNGHVLLLKGGFPNPTGKEIQYAGVPYSFKIFALLEAQKLGFDKVLWLDTALVTLKDPKPIFDQIQKTGSFFQEKKNGKRYLLPSTHAILLKETGIDMYTTPCIRARIIGLDLASPNVQSLIDDYYKLVELGTPFLSCFPEEFVLGALVAKYAKQFPFQPFDHLVMNARKLHSKTLDLIKKEGFFFLLEQH